MRANLDSTGGLVYTSAVLLELVEAGLSREDAYALTQAAAMETWQGGAPFRETLRAHAAAAGVKLDEAGLDEVMPPGAIRGPPRPGLRPPRRAPLGASPGLPVGHGG